MTFAGGPSTEAQQHRHELLCSLFDMNANKFKTPKGNLQKLINSVYGILERTGIGGLADEELSELKKLVFGASIPEEEWRPFVVFREEGYSRNLVDQGNGNFDLLLVAWNPGQSR